MKTVGAEITKALDIEIKFKRLAKRASLLIPTLNLTLTLLNGDYWAIYGCTQISTGCRLCCRQIVYVIECYIIVCAYQP